MLILLTLYADAEGHRHAWASHSSYAAGGRPDARTQAGCRSHRCRHKVYWDRKYRELSPGAKRWLTLTGNCETRGHRRYFASYRVDGYHDGRYQFLPSTARSAGFTRLVWRVYFREQDVRAWRWRLREGAGQWPNCAAW